jgi:hypothetical protein
MGKVSSGGGRSRVWSSSATRPQAGPSETERRQAALPSSSAHSRSALMTSPSSKRWLRPIGRMAESPSVTASRSARVRPSFQLPPSQRRRLPSGGSPKLRERRSTFPIFGDSGRVAEDLRDFHQCEDRCAYLVCVRTRRQRWRVRPRGHVTPSVASRPPVYVVPAFSGGVVSIRKIGWSAAIRRTSSPDEFASTPPKK